MASTTNRKEEKKMEYRRVSFDINEIAPDAPAGEWMASIPRGKCKVQPTKKDQFPMIILPVRLDSTEEEDEKFQKSLGTELGVFMVFGGSNARNERMAKLNIREICEALDIDLDIIPKDISGADDLDPLIRALEGKKCKVWTRLQTRKDTGEVVSEVLFRDPNRVLSAAGNDDDDDDNEDEDERPASRGKKKVPSNKSNGRGNKRG